MKEYFDQFNFLPTFLSIQGTQTWQSLFFLAGILLPILVLIAACY
ncbi:hypothetical protein HSB1_39370 [Halogranum salarium B-1]|uniref:Uncharacterized protein n=1 Tax=Halogranum salarium B-1 TaxID=1210908 RepID=J3JDK8_9EURY|nr:hypothetical protein HSB1_39370 [Halogranum salarium B-1]